MFLFYVNFIGVACARTLHYQFYVWYFHTLPALLWAVPYLGPLRPLLLLCIEVVWNIYPPRAAASAVLQVAHLLLLVAVMTVPPAALRDGVDPTATVKLDGKKER